MPRNRTKKRLRVQFTLRSLMGFVFVTALLGSWAQWEKRRVASEWRSEQPAIQEIRGFGGRVYTERRAPSWLVLVMLKDERKSLDRTVHVSLPLRNTSMSDYTEAVARCLPTLQQLESVSISGNAVDDILYSNGNLDVDSLKSRFPGVQFTVVLH